MKRSHFLFVTAVISFSLGAILFFSPAFGAQLLGLTANIEDESVLRAMGGMTIGIGTINFLLRSNTDQSTLKAILITNITIHALGLATDILGIYHGAITVINIAPIETIHFFVGIGSILSLMNLKTT